MWILTVFLCVRIVLIEVSSNPFTSIIFYGIRDNITIIITHHFQYFLFFFFYLIYLAAFLEFFIIFKPFIDDVPFFCFQPTLYLLLIHPGKFG